VTRRRNSTPERLDGTNEPLLNTRRGVTWVTLRLVTIRRTRLWKRFPKVKVSCVARFLPIPNLPVVPFRVGGLWSAESILRAILWAIRASKLLLVCSGLHSGIFKRYGRC